MSAVPETQPGGGEEAARPLRKRHPKLGHTKSRGGCDICRSRRVKCDETKPSCGNCGRLDLTCTYARQSRPRAQSGISRVSMPTPDSDSSHSRDTLDMPESEARRKLELELFYHYSTEAASTLPADGASHIIWGPIVCRAALKSDAVLYCVCLVSILHKAHMAGLADLTDAEHCSTYLSMALQEHQRDVSQLSAANVDYACLSTNLLRVHGFARLQHRSREPYTPPIDWLRMTGTTHAIFLKAHTLQEVHLDSIGREMLGMVTHLVEEMKSLQHSDDLSHLMRRQEPHELAEPWDEDVRRAYGTTLSLLGGIWKHRYGWDGLTRDVCLRIVVFPMLLENKFVDMVEEGRPRALVILAHYFTALMALRKLWYVGDTGLREAQAIVYSLGAEWQDMLEEPRAMIRTRGG